MLTKQRVDQIVLETNPSQNKEELRALLTLLSKLPKNKIKCVLEIGVHRGGSLEVWKKAFNPKRLVGVEWDREAIKVAKLLVPEAIIFDGDSKSGDIIRDVRASLPERVDFLFIDGDHAYDSVKKDFEIYSQLVNEGGVIVFHDITVRGNPACGVHKFWDELSEKEDNIDFISKDVENGGTGYGVVWR